MTARRREGGWTLALTNDYVDATAFGDTTRTYLVGLRDAMFTWTPHDGGDEVRLPFPWNHVTAEITTTALTTTNTTAPVPVNPALFPPNHARILMGHAPATTTTNTPLADVRLQGLTFRNNLMTRAQYEEFARQVTNAAATFDYTMFGRIQPPADPVATRRKEKARARAMKLLRANLDKRQLGEVEAHKRFRVKGQKLTYVIDTAGNVRTVKPAGDFCLHPYGEERFLIPGPDQALAIKLMIEADEVEFLRIANWTGEWGTTLNEVHLGRMNIDGRPHQDTFGARIYGGGKKDPTRAGYGNYVTEIPT